MKRRLAIGMIIPLTLAGCGGSDGPDDKEIEPIPEPKYEFVSGDFDNEASVANTLPAGVYQFSQTAPGNNNDDDAQAESVDLGESAGVALISPTGRLTYVTATEHEATRIKIDGHGRFAATLQPAYSADTETESGIVITGEANVDAAGATITGALVGESDRVLIATYSMAHNRIVSEAAGSLEDIAGDYRETNADGIVKTISVSADGIMSGSDTTGCNFDGKIINPRAATNLVEAQYTASNCGPSAEQSISERNGTFYALGYASPTQHTLHLFSTSETAKHRFSGKSVATPIPEVVGFVSDNLSNNTLVSQTLNPGVFAYEEVKPGLTAEQRLFREAELQVMETDLTNAQAEYEALTVDPSADEAEIEAKAEEIAALQEDIASIQDSLALPDTGSAIVSTTGRVAIEAGQRTAFAHVRLNETLTFINPALDFERDADSTAPRESVNEGSASSIFGVSEDQLGTPGIIGNLMTDAGAMDTRYLLIRDSASSDASASLAAIAGTYSMQWGTNITSTFTIDAAGNLSGSDNTGCTFGGKAVVPNTTLNVLEARFEASNCQATDSATGAERNGMYNAVGTMADASTMMMLMTNKTYSFNFAGTR